MCTSIRTTSGLSASTALMASSPDATSPQRRISFASARSARAARRGSRLSSTTRTRSGLAVGIDPAMRAAYQAANRRLPVDWVFLAALALGLVVLNYAFRGADALRPDHLVEVLFLAVAAALMNILVVVLERGRLTLNGIIDMAVAILLNPLDASLISLL